MSRLLIDLSGRYRAAYGFTPRLLKQDITALSGSQSGSSAGSIRVYTRGDGSFENLTLVNGTTELRFSNTLLLQKGTIENVFAPPPMISYRKAKRLIITEIKGADTEIVEQYNNGTWELRIQGILVDMDGHRFPKQKLQELRNMFDVKDNWVGLCETFEALGITNLYFTDIEIVPVQGYEDTVSFFLEARASRAAEFYLNGEEV